MEHNTIDFDGTTAVYAYGGSATAPRPITEFRFVNNALRHNQYGINGASSSYGNTALSAYFPGAAVQGNWLQGGSASRSGGQPVQRHVWGRVPRCRERRLPRVGGSVLIGAATDGTNIGADMFALLKGVRPPAGSTSLRAPGRPAGLRVLR